MTFVGVEHMHVAVKRHSAPILLHGYFERQVRRVPHRVAVECGGDILTYLELDRYANQIAHTLRQSGVTTGSLVGVLLEKSPRLYATILGILKAGAGYVPLDSKFPSDRIAGILADCQATAVVSEACEAAKIRDAVPAPFLLLDADAILINAHSDRKPSLHRLEVGSSNLCYVIYTSGSTGHPKGVMITHGNAAAFVNGMCQVYEVDGKDRIYQGFSVAFDASVEEIWLAFSLGATLVVPSEEISRSPADAAEFINASRITYFSTIPTFLSMIEQELPTVRTLVLGGEACPSKLVDKWAQPWRRMLNTYGPTEATVVTTLAECRAGEPVTIGRPLPGYRIYVFDESLKPVAPGEVGELYIAGSAVARGYMNSPQQTEERFVQNPLREEVDRLYRTGDLVRLLEEGGLQFIGRIDGQIKIRGFRVELSEIEAVLQQQAGIQAAAVNAVNTPHGLELGAYVICEDAANVDRGMVATALRRRLPEYMVPKYLDFVAELPLTTSGKIDRKALSAPVTLLKGSTGGGEAPADELERRLAEAWQRTLNLQSLSVTDDFFVDLRGHSLLAAQAVTALRACLGGALISVRDFYRHRTVRAMANSLRERGAFIDATESASDADDVFTPSEVAFNHVGRLTRGTVSLLQALSVVVFYSVVSAPIAYGALMVLAVIEGRIAWTDAAWISTVVGFALWPATLAFTIGLKWLVIGRYRPGKYPIWGFYYFRWWLVTRFQSLAWASMFSGTPLMSLYYRAMGAKIGKRVTLSTPHCMAFDVVSIGDDTSVGIETQMLGYRVEDGMLIIAPVTIGRDCFVGMHCNLGLDTCLQDGSRLDDMSLLVDGSALGIGEMQRGVPAMPARVPAPGDHVRNSRGKRRTFLFGLLHLGLIYAMGYFLLLTTAPAIALIAAGLYIGGPWAGIAGAMLSVPLLVASYVASVIALKRFVIGRLCTGTVHLDSVTYLRHWFAQYLMENTRYLLMPLYATIYLPTFLRKLGARVGAGTEISTVAHVCPDHLEIGAGSFLADACLVGGNRIHGGFMQTAPVTIGAKSFVGNSALVPGGSVIGDNVLIGVASTPPEDQHVPTDTAWLGSPSFSLPRTQKDCCFPDAATFNPTPRMMRQRAIIDAARVLVPGFLIMGNLILFVTALVLAYRALPLWGVIAAIPLIDAVLSFNAILIVALIKKACLGALGPMVRPLWSRFVWLNEFVNAVYEGVGATVMTPLLGTRMAAPCLRMMGCKVGKWVYLDTTLFSEFDLVDIGDHAQLNIGSTIQTHLFEDRIFKADTLSIGRGCSVGNMAVVLYGTQMRDGSCLGPLSVLMKGEQLLPGTTWSGIPCEQLPRRLASAPPPLPNAGARDPRREVA